GRTARCSRYHRVSSRGSSEPANPCDCQLKNGQRTGSPSRQVHRHDHSAHDYSQEQDHHRLQQRQQARHRDVDLVVVEIGDLAEHLVETAGLFTDCDHRDHHRRENARLLERSGNGVTAGDRGERFHNCVLDDRVAGGLGGDFQFLSVSYAQAKDRASTIKFRPYQTDISPQVGQWGASPEPPRPSPARIACPAGPTETMRPRTPAGRVYGESHRNWFIWREYNSRDRRSAASIRGASLTFPRLSTSDSQLRSKYSPTSKIWASSNLDKASGVT